MIRSQPPAGACARALACATAVCAFAGPASAQTWERAAIVSAVDSIVSAALEGGRAAGAAVAVVRGADTLVLRGWGHADLEWDVPMPADAVFEIGSVTKQFTAAAVLQLVEQGRLDLDADMTTYFPDYPTQGHAIPLRRLLDHTSGIRGYTEMRAFRDLAPLDLPRDTLVTLVAAEPFDFAPGEALVYNNSAYFLLGLIVEKASGMSYEEYVETEIFPAAGMERSRYCDNAEIVERRANGYQMTSDGLRRAPYLDHTWPYAAGSLCSTVGDLVAWNRALHEGRLLSPAMYRELTTPGRLKDGTPVRYAMGIVVDSVLGRPALAHGGGIFGFLSDLIYFPEDSLTIAVLVNTTGPVSPAALARGIAEVIYGPWEPETVAFGGDPAAYAGEYRGVGRGSDLVLTIAAGPEGGLTLQRGSAPARPLTWLGGDTFGSGRARYTFVREGGEVVGLRADQVSGYSLLERVGGREDRNPPASGSRRPATTRPPLSHSL